MVFVERRRPAPVLVVEAADLHPADADLVLGDDLDYGFGNAARANAATLLAGSIGRDAFARPAARLRDRAARLICDVGLSRGRARRRQGWLLWRRLVCAGWSGRPAA